MHCAVQLIRNSLREYNQHIRHCKRLKDNEKYDIYLKVESFITVEDEYKATKLVAKCFD